MVARSSNNTYKRGTTSQRKNGKKRSSTYNEPYIPKLQVLKFIVGIMMLFFALFLILSFSSFISSGSSDYSLLDQYRGNHLPDYVPEMNNACGYWGGQVSFFLINTCFGLAAYIIPVFLALFGLKLIGSFRIKVVRLFILLGLTMIWLSVFFSTPMVYNLPIFAKHIVPGGSNGMDIAKTLCSFLGEPGLYGVLMLVAIFVLLYFSVKTIFVIRNLLRLNNIKKIRNSFAQNSDNGNTRHEVIDDDDVIGDGTVDRDTGEILSYDNNSNKDTAEEKPQSLFETIQNNGGLPIEPSSKDNESTTQEKKVEEKPQSDEVSIEFDNVVRMSGADVKTPSTNVNENVEFSISDNDEENTTSTNITNEDMGINTALTEDKDSKEHFDMSTPYDPHKDLEFYQRPPFSLLEQPDDDGPQIDMEEQTANKEQIIKVLHSFGVEISSIKATIGPTITLYEITPAEGMRISKIRNLEDDIALSLAAEGIRIIAPIPGKGTIGIEVPNKKKSIVSMDSVLESKKFQETKMELPCALGKTITNEVFMIDLAKAPHLLVAGATGMGKSVGLNAIITSLLYKKHPSELKIVMVDPKKVEFSIYSPIENHFLAKLEDEDEPIITDVQHVVKTLNSLCKLMDHRYDMLKRAQVRTIKEYNEKFKARQLDPRVGHEFMPYYVVVIDEFGDLIMTAGKEIELPICRIAQLARAVGIHMIIATQRPSVQIITGAIKANFPARIAFRVAAMQDSRTIIDRPGANQLIGRGDMLYLQGGDPVRVQCAFVDTPEVSRICKYISKQQSYPHATYLPEPDVEGDESGSNNNEDLGHLDPMFAECAKLIVSKQQGSTSLLQRQFSIGYNRAGRLMDQMEKAGVVGPQVGSKPRDVLIQDFNSLDRLISSLM